MWYEYYDHTPITGWDIADQSKKLVKFFFPTRQISSRIFWDPVYEKRHEMWPQKRHENRYGFEKFSQLFF